jgi:predicted nucleic acid-binding protein
MKLLLDTNILLRVSQPSHPHHAPAVASMLKLAAGGDRFCVSSQTVAEFLAVATRSIADRGLAMTQSRADAELSKVTDSLEVLYDSPAVLAELRRLVVAHRVTGKNVHDARLVATMIANGVSDILTFNVQDFARFTEIRVIDPVVFAASK